MNLTISTHYCGGEIAEAKVSLYGELATCGMEGPDDTCTFPGNHLESTCCSSEISFFSVDNNFTTSINKIINTEQAVLQLFVIPLNINLHSITEISHTSTDSGPPENLLVDEVNLSKICVFLI